MAGFYYKISSYKLLFFFWWLFMVLGPSHLEESRFLTKFLAIRDSQETKVSACYNSFEPRTIAKIKNSLSSSPKSTFWTAPGLSHFEESRFLARFLAIRDSQETRDNACYDSFEPRTIAKIKKMASAALSIPLFEQHLFSWPLQLVHSRIICRLQWAHLNSEHSFATSLEPQPLIVQC